MTSTDTQIPADIAPLPAKVNGNGHANGSTNGNGHSRAVHDAGNFSFEERTPAAAPSGDAKLAATTRMVNAFMGYVKNVGGRDGDQLTNDDTAKLLQTLKILDDVGNGNGRKRY